MRDNHASEQPTPGAGLYSTVVARRSRRRKQVVAGAAGLLLILGAGAFLAQQVGHNGDTVANRNVGALAPVTVPSTASSPTPPETVGAEPTASPSSAPPTSRAAAATPSPSTVSQRAAKARVAASRAGTQVTRPLPVPAGGAQAEGITVTNSGSLKEEGGTIRVVTARGDLTGQRELAWVADEGEPVGKARCTKKIRVSPDLPARERPTLLLCWRTSAKKSVFTIAVDLDGPSKYASVARLDKEWSKLS